MCDLLTDPFVEHLRSERQQRIPTDQELVLATLLHASTLALMPMTREPHAIEMRLETRTPCWSRAQGVGIVPGSSE